MQLSHLHFIIEFDIKGFFDNVNHPKLIKQILAIGIRDKDLIYVLRQILLGPIRMPDGKMVNPTKGTPQGGIISPLLANIVLNELDHWIESQWQANPVTRKYAIGLAKNGSENLGHGYRAIRDTNLKEMFIVRYADDFRIFCRNKSDALKTKIAVTQWLAERLKLEVSQEKTRIVNVRHGYSDFLGIKMRVREKGQKKVVQSHISDKSLEHKKAKLMEQAKRIASPRDGKSELEEICLYNAMVMGMQNYYRLATDISDDFNQLNHSVMTIFTNRLNTEKGCRLVRKGRPLTEIERQRYGRSKRLRYVAGTGEPIYPIGQVRRIRPRCKQRSWCSYTPEGRAGLHDNLRINVHLMLKLMRQPLGNRSIEYADNRISLFCSQWGKCAVTGKPFRSPKEVHCHHIKPRHCGGGDEYGNLILLQNPTGHSPVPRQPFSGTDVWASVALSFWKRLFRRTVWLVLSWIRLQEQGDHQVFHKIFPASKPLPIPLTGSQIGGGGEGGQGGHLLNPYAKSPEQLVLDGLKIFGSRLAKQHADAV